MSSCPEDDDYNQKCQENFLFHVKGTKATSRLFSNSGICTAGQASLFTWSYQDNTQYWELNVVENNIFSSKVYRCKNVWWFNPQLVVEKIPSGVFHVYMRHGGQTVSTGEFKIYRVGSDGKEKQIEKTVRPFRNHFSFLRGTLQNTYACTVDVSDFEGETVDLKFEFFQSSSCIGDYLFEGVILVPVNDLETPPLQYFQLAQDRHLEIDWNLRTSEIVLVTVESGREVEELEEEPDDEPIESFDKVKLEGVSDYFREKILALYTEIWHKYDADKNNHLTEDEFINLMDDIYERLEIPNDRESILAFFKRSDVRNTGQLYRQDIIWLIQQTAGLLEQKEQRMEAQRLEKEQQLVRQKQDEDMPELLKKYNDQFIPLNGTIAAVTTGTTHESADNLLSGRTGGSKWCVTGSGNGSVTIELEEDIEFNCFGLRSANDCPQRDPVIVELKQMGLPEDDSGMGVKIFRREEINFRNRFQVKLYRLPQTVTGSIFKIYLESDSSEIQLCQIIFAKVDEE